MTARDFYNKRLGEDPTIGSIQLMEEYAEVYYEMKMNESDGSMLTPANKKRMWHIDAQAQVGNDLSNEEVAFFNAHLDLMKRSTREEFEHFEYHSGKL